MRTGRRNRTPVHTAVEVLSLFHILQYVKERIAIIEVFFFGVEFGIILAYR